MLRAFLVFVKAWLLFGFVCVFFVAPLYLVAIFPDVPEPMVRASRAFGYGVVRAPPSEATFWYRLAGCAAVVAMGCAMIFSWTRGSSTSQDDQANPPNGTERSRRSKRRK
jgi:hypothetical protein